MTTVSLAFLALISMALTSLLMAPVEPLPVKMTASSSLALTHSLMISLWVGIWVWEWGVHFDWILDTLNNTLMDKLSICNLASKRCFQELKDPFIYFCNKVYLFQLPIIMSNFRFTLRLFSRILLVMNPCYCKLPYLENQGRSTCRCCLYRSNKEPILYEHA